MAKKLGKFMLVTAAIGTAAAAAYYYLQKKDTSSTVPEDEDYDDFSEDLDEAPDSARSYVPLTPETKNAEETKGADETEKKDSFTPLTETVAHAVEKTEETVEEFFDEEDSTDEEPPITDK